jgi:uncharacterized membrane protein YfcA
MTLEWGLIAELLLLGTCTGFLAGFLGIGGATLLVPFTTLILSQRGVDPQVAVKYAIATSMAVILFTSLSSAWAHHRRGAVLWRLVFALAPGIVAGGLLAGAGVFPLLKGATLSILFALFVTFTATQLLRDAKPSPSRQLPGPAGSVAVGSVIGFVSGLVGAGGAFISIPFMAWCNVAIHNAVATSAALGFPIALGNTVGYVAGGWGMANPLPASLGYVWLPGLVVPACASVLLAPLGARAAHAMDTKSLRRAFAWVMYALAAYMLWHAIT